METIINDLTNDLDLSLREAIKLRPTEQLYLLCDNAVRQTAVAQVLSTLPIADSHILSLTVNEQHKSLQTVCLIWDFLESNGACRSSLLLIVGGGVLTDMGGFAAATFKRGIEYVNIPTTLLAMVDAADGGKTGFNYGGLKNEIGLFAFAQQTINYVPFLQTLPYKEFLSGFGEMLKHALIASPLELARVMGSDIDKLSKNVSEPLLSELIARSIEIKRYIIEQDPEEKSLRKTLNFGHTIGHALEEMSFMQAQQEKQQSPETMLHGFAVAYGIVAELYLSHIKLSFPQSVLTSVSAFVREYWGKPACACSDYDQLLELMRHDKKNASAQQINFTLLRAVGDYRINQLCTDNEIKDALDYLMNM